MLKVALVALASSMITVSSDSSILSSFTAKLGRLTVVAPAEMVTVPAVNVKSVPEPVAVPPVTEYCTVATLAEGLFKLIWITGAAVDSAEAELLSVKLIVDVSLSLIV